MHHAPPFELLTCPRVTVAGEITLADLVADSEDEEYLSRSKDLLQPRKVINPPQPDPRTTATVMVDNAAASTSRGEARVEPEVATKKSRPKPRKKLPTGSIDPAPSAPPTDFSSTTTTVLNTTVTIALPERIPPAEPRPQDVPLTIADRAKSRARNAKSKPVPQDIIGMPSDEDERLLQLSPYRPGQKDVRGVKNRPIPDPPLPSIHPSQESLVVPTSDYQPAPAVSSQLPPSDPPSSTLPLPTSTPESAKKRRQVAGDPEESPLNPSKKRKRQRVVMDDEVGNEAQVPPSLAMATVDQPPPNFFASSSSSLPPPPAPLVQVESGKKKPTKRKQPTDDVLLPEVADPEPPKEKKSRPKPKRKSGVRPEPSETEQPPSVPASTSRPRPNAKEPTYKSVEIIDDSDEETGLLTLPPPPRLLDSQSPLSDLSEQTGPGSPKPTTPSGSRKRLIPEVVITTVPRKRASSPLIREAEERGGVDRDGVNASPKGKKRQKKAVEDDYPDGPDDQVEVVPKKGSKGKGKAPPKGRGRTKPQVVDDGEFEEDPTNNPAGTSRKAKSKATTKATAKKKATRSGKPRVMDSDDEVTLDDSTKDSDVVLVDNEQAGNSSMAQKNSNGDETPPLQDAKEDQENTPPPPKPAKSDSNPTVTPSVSRKTPAPGSASSFTRLNYGHSLASEEKPASMAEIIRRAASATGTPSGIKTYSPFAKGSRSVLKKIAPLHARRKTPPPLPPKPPPPKKTKKQLELEEKWEEELEETIEGWAALSSQEREVLRKQKRDMEMGYEDW